MGGDPRKYSENVEEIKGANQGKGKKINTTRSNEQVPAVGIRAELPGDPLRNHVKHTLESASPTGAWEAMPSIHYFPSPAGREWSMFLVPQTPRVLEKTER